MKIQNENLNGLSFYDHHLLKKDQGFSLGKFNSKELCNTLRLGNYEKTTSQVFCEAFFESSTTDWKGTFLLTSKTTIYTKHQSFQ